jgi:hypothetical protein
MPEPAPKAAMKFGAGAAAVVAAVLVLDVAEVVVAIFFYCSIMGSSDQAKT